MSRTGRCLITIVVASTTALTVGLGTSAKSAPTPVASRVLIGALITRRPAVQNLIAGTVLPSSDIFSTRVFSSTDRGVALATSRNSADYPVTTTDGGQTWRVAGPILHIAAADGADGVNAVGLSGTGIYFAWGFNAVDVTNDSGAAWFRVHLPGQVVAVVPGDHGLAIYEQLTNAANRVTATVQYVSTDGGRKWLLSNSLGG